MSGSTQEDIRRKLILVSLSDIIVSDIYPNRCPMFVGLRAAQREGIGIILEDGVGRPSENGSATQKG